MRETALALPSRRVRNLIVTWLVVVAVLVFAMIVLGGVTRLTNSGLSMTDWKPVTGWLPPLNHEAWMAEFERYKAYPEYQKINHGMTLDEFKGIYAFEFSHRLLGRLIGVAFFAPFALFLIARKIRGPLVPRLAAIFVLGALQGGMGWFMVKSGLVDHPDVSHFRLTAHLALASLIYSVILWTIFDLLRPAQAQAHAGAVPLKKGAVALLALIALQILIGGFVAGINAGFIYNDWPTMGGVFLPEDAFHMTPFWLNFLENPVMIQFCHRMVGYLVAISALVLFLAGWKTPLSVTARRAIALLLGVVVAQVLLGIMTLIHVVPVPLAAAHQAGGILVLSAALFLVHDRFRIR